MAFSAADVKNLREMTGVGMMDCKKALSAADGDIDKAVEWLREKGLAAAQKKAGRIAAEGMAYAAVIDGVGVIIEVNAESDFVAKNDLFVEYVKGPVTGLDPASMQDLYKTLRYLNEREGMAIIMVTHDIENALREAKHILCVDRAGCFYGTVDEFLSSPAGKRFGGERA